jgi:hypothetical protein
MKLSEKRAASNGKSIILNSFSENLKKGLFSIRAF